MWEDIKDEEGGVTYENHTDDDPDYVDEDSTSPPSRKRKRSKGKARETEANEELASTSIPEAGLPIRDNDCVFQAPAAFPGIESFVDPQLQVNALDLFLATPGWHEQRTIFDGNGSEQFPGPSLNFEFPIEDFQSDLFSLSKSADDLVASLNIVDDNSYDAINCLLEEGDHSIVSNTQTEEPIWGEWTTFPDE
jgi:hypothetical protein